MGPTRSEGYRRGAGKEEAGLNVVQQFFEQVPQVPLRRIEDREENYLRGDFSAPNGQALECKRQPIGTYPENFIEVCEQTTGQNPDHLDGLSTLSRVIGIAEDSLSLVTVTDCRKGGRGKGQYPFFKRKYEALSVSVTSLSEAVYWVYVNPKSDGRYVYIYRSTDLLELIRKAALKTGFNLGKGESNEDTFSVQVPNPDWRWTGAADKAWRFIGSGEETDAIRELRKTLEFSA
jgi:hypothetical protein